MHDIWNPWHGCVKCSEGCQNCYMYFLDRVRGRSDVKFFLLTKRPQRVMDCLPGDWGKGWENIFFNGSCENQKRADERIPILLELPFRHKGVMCAPLIGKVSLKEYLGYGQIEQVICGGENYDGARYFLPKKMVQSRMAFKSRMSYTGRKIEFHLTDSLGWEIAEEDLYVPHYGRNCEECGSRPICNGCSDCGKCSGVGR